MLLNLAISRCEVWDREIARNSLVSLSYQIFQGFLEYPTAPGPLNTVFSVPDLTPGPKLRMIIIKTKQKNNDNNYLFIYKDCQRKNKQTNKHPRSDKVIRVVIYYLIGRESSL